MEAAGGGEAIGAAQVAVVGHVQAQRLDFPGNALVLELGRGGEELALGRKLVDLTQKLRGTILSHGGRQGRERLFTAGTVLQQPQQRKGIGVGGGHTEGNSPLYVVKVDADKAQVIVGPREALACDVICLKDCNWLGAPDGDVLVKLRSVSQPVTARLDRASNTLTLAEPQFGVSPGQAAVCYQGTKVLGGGWISATSASAVPQAA